MARAIETRYRGYRMRSRLEARWATFYDALGLGWVYEPEGYILEDGAWYLPDFKIEGIGWIEIKPEEFTRDEWMKLGRLCDETGIPGFMFAGNIPSPDDWGLEVGTMPGLNVMALFPDGGDDECYWFCVCEGCGKVGLEYQARAARVCRGHMQGDRSHNGNHPRIVDALMAARGARFEHVEQSKGATA